MSQFTELDLESLRLSQNFPELLGVKKAMLTVPLRKPNKHEFFRTHPTWSFPAPVLKMQGDRKDDLFLVKAPVIPVLPDQVTPMMFIATISRQDTFTLWPCRLPGPDGRQDEWSKTAFEAAMMARTEWIRMAANQNLGAYEVFKPIGEFPEPVWPAMDWPAILQIAFRDHVIEDADHPAVRRLRGEI